MAQYVIDNAANLGFKEGQLEPTIAFFTAAMPHLKALAEID
jgi:hypothetical protein